jgi:hypothetical protein
MMSNLLFVRAPARIEAWYQPVILTKTKPPTLYSIFWGPQQLLLSKGKNYRFSIGELPGSLLTSLDSVSPIVQPTAEPKGSILLPQAPEAPKVVEVTPELPKVEAVEAEPPKAVEALPAPKTIEVAPEPPKAVEVEPPKVVEVAPKPVEPVEIAEPIKVTAEPPVQPSAEVDEDEKGFLDTVSEFLGITGESKEEEAPKAEAPKEVPKEDPKAEAPKAEEPKEVPKEAAEPPKEPPKESEELDLGLDDLGEEAPALEG